MRVSGAAGVLASRTLALVVLGAFVASGPARADDAELQRTLQAARCAAPKVTVLTKAGSTTVYQAACANGTGEVITVTCGRSGCHREEDETSEQE